MYYVVIVCPYTCLSSVFIKIFIRTFPNINRPYCARFAGSLNTCGGCGGAGARGQAHKAGKVGRG